MLTRDIPIISCAKKEPKLKLDFDNICRRVILKKAHQNVISIMLTRLVPSLLCTIGSVMGANSPFHSLLPSDNTINDLLFNNLRKVSPAS